MGKLKARAGTAVKLMLCGFQAHTEPIKLKITQKFLAE